jgi:hypothetical protein
MMSTSEPVSIIDLAAQAGRRKQTIFKVLARLNIQTMKQRGSRGRGQLIAYVTAEEAKRILDELQVSAESATKRATNCGAQLAVSEAERSVFYQIALEPQHDPGRFKVGFAVGFEDRLRHLRCSAPLLKVVGTWPCKRLWEKTAIDAVTGGCDRLHTEVFRTNSIAAISERCERFFALMPNILGNHSEGK